MQTQPRLPPPEEAWVAARHLVAGRTKGEIHTQHQKGPPSHVVGYFVAMRQVTNRVGNWMLKQLNNKFPGLQSWEKHFQSCL